MGSIPSPRSLLVLVFVFRRRKNTTHRRTRRRRRRRRRTRRVTPRELLSVGRRANGRAAAREEESFFNAIGNWKKVKRIHTHKEMRKAARTKEHNKALRDDRNAPEGLSPAPGTSHGLIASPDASGVSFVDDPPFVKVVVSHGFGGGGVPTDIFIYTAFSPGEGHVFIALLHSNITRVVNKNQFPRPKRHHTYLKSKT